MRCYTYKPNSKKQFEDHIDFSNFSNHLSKEKTIAVQLYTDEDCDIQELVELIKTRKDRDAFLYGIVNFIKGNSISKVIPEDCFLILVPLDCVPYIGDKSLTMAVHETGRLQLCYKDETCLLDKNSNKTIKNIKGLPTITENTQKIESNLDDGILLEF